MADFQIPKGYPWEKKKAKEKKEKKEKGGGAGGFLGKIFGNATLHTLFVWAVIIGLLGFFIVMPLIDGVRGCQEDMERASRAASEEIRKNPY